MPRCKDFGWYEVRVAPCQQLASDATYVEGGYTPQQACKAVCRFHDIDPSRLISATLITDSERLAAIEASIAPRPIEAKA